MRYNENKLESLSRLLSKPFLVLFAIFLLYSSYICYRLEDNTYAIPHMITKILIGFSFFLLCITILILLKLKEPRLSLFDGIIKNRYPIVFAVFAFLVVFKLHGISLNVWDKVIPSSSFNSGITSVLGMDRSITSDVWGITVPLFFNQVDAGFPFYNTDIMTNGANAVLFGLPVLDITGIGRPSLWGFFLLGKEMGLSWYYWFRMLGLLLTSFELGMFFTKGHKQIALMGAFAIALSPLTQWWSGHILPEILLYAQMMLCGGLYYLANWSDLRKKLIAAAVVLVSMVSFVILLSPSLQVPLGYMVLIIAVGAVYDYRDKIKIAKKDVIIIVTTMLISMAIIGRFFYISWGDIQLISNTIYPGKRFENGGGYTLNMAFYNLFQWMLPYKAVVLYNNCEVSVMIPFIPIVLIAMPVTWKFDKSRRPLYIALYAYMIFCISWLLLRYPDIVAKLTMFSNVTYNRLMWTVGVMSVYFGMICFAHILKHKHFRLKYAAIITTVLAFSFLIIILRSNGYDYLKSYLAVGTVITICVYSIFHISFMMGFKRLLAVVLGVLLLVCGVAVVPLNHGTGAIFDRPLTSEIMEIDHENPDAYWLYDSGYPMGNYLSAHGLKVFNVTNLYPDFEKWQKIDPDQKWSNVYNRYAQVSVALTNTQTNMEILGPEHIMATLTIEDLHMLNVDFIVSTENLEYLNDGSLTEMTQDPDSSARIYRLSKK